MTSILTNTSAMSALASLNATQRQLSTTQAQVSSGLAVANASDNAAYWSIATTMKSEVAGLSAVQQSLGLTGALMAVTSTAIGQIIGLVQGIGADLVTAQEAGVDRRSVQSDIAARQASLNATLASAAFNGVNLLVGANTSQSTSRLDYFDTTKASFDAGFAGDIYHTVYIRVGGVLVTQEINYVHSTGPGAYADTSPLNSFGSSMLGTVGSSGSGVLTFPTGFGGVARTSSVDLSALTMTASDTTSSSDSIAFQNPSGGSITYNAGSGTVVGGSGILDRSLSASDPSQYSVLTLDVSQMSDAALSGIQGSISSVLADLQSAAARVGAVQTQVSTMQLFNSSLSDALISGVGSLVDADMNVASTRLQALQTQQQLGIQALSMANQNSQLILKLFQAA